MAAFRSTEGDPSKTWSESDVSDVITPISFRI